VPSGKTLLWRIGRRLHPVWRYRGPVNGESVSRMALLTPCWPRFPCCRSCPTAQSASYVAIPLPV